MASTTNFGWTTPDNTGYVKDGALAIRTLGSAIDTTLVDLKGGTTDQVLKKASGTDMDFVWGTVSSTPRIAQVVTAGTTSVTSTTTTSYIDISGLSVTITPTLSTSKILIVASFGVTASSGSTAYFNGFVRLLQGSTELQSQPAGGYYPGSSPYTNLALYVPFSIQYVDSPATTSATTYKMQIGNLTGANVVNAGATFGGQVQISALEILV